MIDPYTDGQLLPTSHLYQTDEGQLAPIRPGVDAKAGPALEAARAALQAFLLHQNYPCVGAKTALAHETFVLGDYGEMGGEDAGAACAIDLAWFAKKADEIDKQYATFIALFSPQEVGTADRFEGDLWRQLQMMNFHDQQRHPWDDSYSDNPTDPNFAYSVGGEAFYVIGMHPGADRESRRFPYPALVFNLHRQFETLREAGRFEKMRTLIRDREEELDGSPNPTLADHGTKSEAEQYAGVPHTSDWKPPFRNLGQSPASCPHRSKDD